MDDLAKLRRLVEEREAAIEAVHDEIADLVRRGKQVQEVADAAGYHRNHVGRIARARGVPDARHRRQSMTEKQKPPEAKGPAASG